MKNPKTIFHAISYLQYPIILVAIYYYVIFIISFKSGVIWNELNNCLVFIGISLSISTLQDTSKTQNKLSKKVWESPKKGKLVLIIMASMAAIFLIIGVIGYIYINENTLKEISFGLIVLAIGLIGVLKSAIEMFENHRKDKN